MASTRTYRPALALVAVAIAIAAVLAAIPDPAVADPRPTIREVQSRVEALHHEAEQATERYNSARYRLQQVQRRLTKVRHRLARQRATVKIMQRDLGRFAAASYKSGGIDATMQLLLSKDPAAFLQQASALDQLGRRQTSVLRRVTLARQQLAQDRLAVAQQRDRALALRRRMADEKRTVLAKLERAEDLLATLKAEQRARLAAARAAARAAAEQARASRSAPRSVPSYSGPASGRAAVAVKTAYAQLGDPYVWAADGPDSFDCSGLTMYAWAAAGVSLPHSSSMQYSSGRPVSQSDLQPGDLVFFYSPISHVGIYIGGGQMIHAPHPGASVEIGQISWMPWAGAVRP